MLSVTFAFRLRRVSAFAYPDLFMLAQFLYERQEPYAGGLAHVGILTRYVLRQDGAQCPGQDVVILHI